jgi:hypothetical protein
MRKELRWMRRWWSRLVNLQIPTGGGGSPQRRKVRKGCWQRVGVSWGNRREGFILVQGLANAWGDPERHCIVAHALRPERASFRGGLCNVTCMHALLHIPIVNRREGPRTRHGNCPHHDATMVAGGKRGTPSARPGCRGRERSRGGRWPQDKQRERGSRRHDCETALLPCNGRVLLPDSPARCPFPPFSIWWAANAAAVHQPQSTICSPDA